MSHVKANPLTTAQTRARSRAELAPAIAATETVVEDHEEQPDGDLPE